MTCSYTSIVVNVVTEEIFRIEKSNDHSKPL